MSRPCYAQVDLEALRHNYRLAGELAPSAQAVAVVKANAYGHGAVEAAKALEPLAPALGVACIEEALELRHAGIQKPILLLEGIFSADEVAIASEEHFFLMVENLEQIEAIIQADIDQALHCWLKVDTGMHRLGLLPEQVDAALAVLKASPNVQPDIIMASHFASADELDNPSNAEQLRCFDKLIAECEQAQGLDQSLANSATILAHPSAHRQWLRPGFMLYGASPFTEDNENAAKLKPVMSLISEVISLRPIQSGERVGYGGKWQAERDSIIATIACGYGDGYPRHASNGTPVLIDGQEAPLVGRVSMDMITVDVTDIANVQLGSRAEMWGKNLCVNRIAEHAHTIAYELLTRMPARPPRVYQNEHPNREA
ncbi:alanine racemase [Pseudoteredinibacter isoporae]|uniref:alanine racemase n=1 Tax=Pseudoteredinibacter isoporae TaxID=570281 RepID=UPI00310AEFE0